MSILPSSYSYHFSSQVQPKLFLANISRFNGVSSVKHTTRRSSSLNLTRTPPLRFMSISASLQQLDLSEDNVKQVLLDAREKFSHIFDTSVGMTGVAELAEVDGPYVKISLKGRFWHERSLILARLGNYLKQRIPEILEVDIEDEKQLDDSPENF
ncbi:Multidrug efflux pump subunit AcrB like [Heracleum sosnowskyi]|uniref:Multidrug efflux pump subunit AcrB like n=1 Tax=Heracleum sosnowskyi TaxID=360622 RepID=A0AAD8J7G1_9APIA|nr:Multidrug efflux pump subunit AcrB like [Heracleum sosnowskyi]